MISKTFFIINVFLNFNFISLKLSDTDLYLRKVVFRQKNTIDHEICYYEIPYWADLCKRIIHHLRREQPKPEYKHLFVNYIAFNESSKCALRDVRLEQLPYPVKQNSLSCPARPWMIPIGTPNQFLRYHTEIIIFPYLKTNIMIFNRIPNTNEYTLLKILREFRWQPKRLEQDVFNISIPMVEENIEVLYPYLRANCSKLYDESINKHNIVNLPDKDRYNLCKSILNSPKYDQEIEGNFIITSSVDGSDKCKTVALHIPQDNFDSVTLHCPIKACPCIGYHPVTNVKITAFSVAAIIDDTSVILLKRTDFFIQSLQLYNVLEYFENVHVAYLHYYNYY